MAPPGCAARWPAHSRLPDPRDGAACMPRSAGRTRSRMRAAGPRAESCVHASPTFSSPRAFSIFFSLGWRGGLSINTRGRACARVSDPSRRWRDMPRDGSCRGFARRVGRVRALGCPSFKARRATSPWCTLFHTSQNVKKLFRVCGNRRGVDGRGSAFYKVDQKLHLHRQPICPAAMYT